MSASFEDDSNMEEWRVIMSKFCIVFLDGEKREVEAIGFSVAKVKAAYERVLTGAKRHTELSVNEKASSDEIKKIRQQEKRAGV